MTRGLLILLLACGVSEATTHSRIKAAPEHENGDPTTWHVPGGGSGDGARIRVVDGDLLALAFLLSEPADGISLSSSWQRREVSGRAYGGSREELRDALFGAFPELDDSLRTSPLTASGREVDVDFLDVDSRAVFDLLADVGGVNVVIGPGELPSIGVRGRSLPWDALLRDLVGTIGWQQTELAPTVFLITPNAVTLTLTGTQPRVDVRVGDDAVPAVALSALLSAAGPVQRRVPCDASQTLSALALRNLPLDDTLTLMAMSAGAPLEAGDAAVCGLARLDDTSALKTIAQSSRSSADPHGALRSFARMQALSPYNERSKGFA